MLGWPALLLWRARRFGVDYLAIDREMLLEYGEESLAGLGRLPVSEALVGAVLLGGLRGHGRRVFVARVGSDEAVARARLRARCS